MRTLMAGLALVLGPVASASAQMHDSLLVRAVDSLAGAAVGSGSVAGVSVAVSRGGRTVVARGYGLADIGRKAPVTPATIFRGGSLAKQFTAAAVMRLAEQGRLSLDDEITRYLPDYPAQGHRVLIRHLLAHTSGIRNYTSLGPRWASRNREPMSADSIIALFAPEPFEFAPGTDFRYNNSGYFLLGRIIEKVTGRPYADVLQAEVIAPLALPATKYCPSDPVPETDASGYSRRGGALVPSAPLNMNHPFAAGALCTSAEDLVRWTLALSGGKVVSPESYRRMITPDPLADGRRMPYGYGLGLLSMAGHPGIAHAGGMNGFMAQLAHFPADSLVVAVMVNTEGDVADRLAFAIARLALSPRD